MYLIYHIPLIKYYIIILALCIVTLLLLTIQNYAKSKSKNLKFSCNVFHFWQMPLNAIHFMTGSPDLRSPTGTWWQLGGILFHFGTDIELVASILGAIVQQWNDDGWKLTIICLLGWHVVIGKQSYSAQDTRNPNSAALYRALKTLRTGKSLPSQPSTKQQRGIY